MEEAAGWYELSWRNGRDRGASLLPQHLATTSSLPKAALKWGGSKVSGKGSLWSMSQSPASCEPKGVGLKVWLGCRWGAATVSHHCESDDPPRSLAVAPVKVE